MAISLTELKISLGSGQKIYFASDFHLGEPDYETTRKREARLISWLDMASRDAAAIFLVGDLFDFWFEYKRVVPKGYVRFLGKIASLVDQGHPVYVFPGNHDMWMKDYLEEELGVQIIRQKAVVESGGHRIFVAHGDGLGPGDTKYKLLKRVFTNPVCRWMFRWLHPDIGIKIAHLWSRRSRLSHEPDRFKDLEKEWLVAYSRRKLESAHFDYFIFGHRHKPIEFTLDNKSRYVNLGDWVESETYAVYDGTDLRLLKYDQ